MTHCSLSVVHQEVFAPILHVIKFKVCRKALALQIKTNIEYKH